MFPSRTEFAGSKESPIIAIPHRCQYPLFSGGYLYSSCVKKGDAVKAGEPIAVCGNSALPPIHTSVPGKIISVIDSNTDSISDPVIIVESSGSLHYRHNGDQPNWTTRSSSELFHRLLSLGVYICKDTPKAGGTLIVNLSDEEPYIATRHRIIMDRSGSLADGISAVFHALESTLVILAVHSHKASSIRPIIQRLTENKTAYRINKISKRYPAAKKEVLLRTCTATPACKPVPGEQDGIFYITAETALAAFSASTEGDPYCEGYVTLAGNAVSHPGVYRIRFGTSIAHLVDEAGGLRSTPDFIINGGPITGEKINSLERPICRSTTGILLLTNKELSSRALHPCIRCGKCIDVCPESLIPVAVSDDDKTISNSQWISRCIQCAACSAVCPSGIPLARLIKSAVNQRGSK